MKKKLLLQLFLIMLFIPLINAQTVVFSDNFDTYTVGASVTTLGYTVWETGAYIKADVPGNSGANYINMAGTAAKSNYVRKTVAVTAGHNYTFSAFTMTPATKNHAIGYKLVSGASTNSALFTNSTWTEHSISFTAVNSENVDLFIYIYGANTVNSDDWKLIDNSVSTATQNTSSASVQLTRSGLNQFSVSGCEVNSCLLYDINGRLLQTAYKNRFDVGNACGKGVYIAKITDKSGLVYHRKFTF